MGEEKLITVAIYTYEKAQIIKGLLESEGIQVAIQNVNLIQPVISSGVRVRIRETDLPHALTILEEHNTLFEQKDVTSLRKSRAKQHIVIPIDFSDYSYKACAVGFDIANKIGAKIIVLHTYIVPYLPDAIPITDTFIGQEEIGEFKKIRESATKQMDDFAQKLKTDIAINALANVQFECIVKEGIPEDEIRLFCRHRPPSLIVMGTRGKGRKETELIGSVTAEVIDSARIPVLAIPENTHINSYSQVSKVAFITNFDQRELITIDTFMRLFGGFNFKIIFIHFVSTKQDVMGEIKMNSLEKYFNKHYPEKECTCKILETKDILTGVNDFIAEEKIDLLSMTTQRRTIFARLFNPGIAHRMIFHSDTPILVLPSNS
ncbi:MAG: universal stress protein [Bacteroidales bacterium]